MFCRHDLCGSDAAMNEPELKLTHEYPWHDYKDTKVRALEYTKSCPCCLTTTTIFQFEFMLGEKKHLSFYFGREALASPSTLKNAYHKLKV